MKARQKILLILFIIYNAFIFAEALTPAKGSSSQSGGITDVFGDIIESMGGDKFTYIHPETIDINGKDTLVKGDISQYSATVTPKDSTNYAVIWTSQTPDIIKVTSAGVVTALKEGNGILRATSDDVSTVYKDFIINVEPKPAITPVYPEKIEFQSFSSTHTMLSKMTKGIGTINFYPEDCNQRGITYTSSNPTVAKIKNNTIFTYQEGITKIIATSTSRSDVFAEFDLIVTSQEATRPSRIDISVLETYYVNRSGKLDISLDNPNVDDPSVVVKISNTDNINGSIASYTNGQIKGLQKGIANIQVCSTFDEPQICSENKQFEVKNVDPTDIKMEIKGNLDEFKSGKSIMLACIFEPGDVTFKDVIWSVNNDNAHISQSGLLVGLKKGEIEVTVTHVDSNFSKSMTLKVLKASSLSSQEWEELHHKVRKLIGHYGLFVGDGILGFMLFLSLDLNKRRKWILLIISGIFVSSIAEILQLIPQGRYFTVLDILINAFGFFSGMLFSSLTYVIVRYIRKRKIEKKKE